MKDEKEDEDDVKSQGSHHSVSSDGRYSARVNWGLQWVGRVV